MESMNVTRVITMQKLVNFQIDTKGQADIELVNDLENMCDSLTSEEIDELLERYEFEKEGEMELMAQWDA
jgi:hypothetical protein